MEHLLIFARTIAFFGLLYFCAIASVLIFIAGRIFELGRFEVFLSYAVIVIGTASSLWFWYLLHYYLHSDIPARDITAAYISIFSGNLTLSVVIASIVHYVRYRIRKRAAKTKEN